MTFKLEKLFVDVFAPQNGDIVTIMYDLPHGEIRDILAWQDRREMANEWHSQIAGFSQIYGIRVNPMVTYSATGAPHSEMPKYGLCKDTKIQLESVIRDSTIIISMPEYSATSPLMGLAKKYKYLRIASMPEVARSMEETGLSANYQEIAKTCTRLASLLERSNALEVTFSTGHTCHFDISDHKPVYQEDGILHPGTHKDTPQLANLPAGEVCTCPNETENSQTAGEIPTVIEGETIVMIVMNNQIIHVKGEGPIAEEKRQEFHQEAALRNIAEVAIGCNDRAVVIGNTLEDEKAGFHWAYGRSDLFGCRIGVEDFTSPDKVRHIDLVYARGNPIVCSRFDFLLLDGTGQTAIIDGVLYI